ncbi:MAG TPA: outer membrane beta-barrel protein [Vicinamibacterales bacterium]|jgi:opacity protein-like surface antigen|nr:outer membrane beta-barrel protein [Vicinamibacterales bacterium]
MLQPHLGRAAIPATRLRLRGLVTLLLSSVFFLLSAATSASAQGAFGIGGRMAMLRADAATNTNSQRFWGGQIRARMSRRTAFELSFDRHRENSGDLTQRIIDSPLQATVMLYPVRSTFSPYFLGGFGWYTHKVQDLTGDQTTDIVSTRRTGYHAGFGAEILAGKHVGIHGDYRYTFIHFGGDSAVGHLIPSYDSSMWTAGATFYF